MTLLEFLGVSSILRGKRNVEMICSLPDEMLHDVSSFLTPREIHTFFILSCNDLRKVLNIIIYFHPYDTNIIATHFNRLMLTPMQFGDKSLEPRLMMSFFQCCVNIVTTKNFFKITTIRKAAPIPKWPETLLEWTT